MKEALGSRPILATVGAYCLFSFAVPLTKWLMVRGMDLGPGGGEAISFCNLLFLGNIAAACSVYALTGPHDYRDGMGKLSPGGRVSLVASATLGIATPAAAFFSLQWTSVANVILISRAGPVIYSLTASVLLGKRITKPQKLGYGFIIVAIGMAILIPNHGSLMSGDLLALAAAAGAALVSLVGRPALRQAGVRPFVISRNVIASCGFACIALYHFGPTHFADLALPGLIVGTSIYGILVVGIGQVLWYYAVLNASPKVVGGFSFVSPLMGIVLTAVLLGEPPATLQMVALGFVSIGMVIAARPEEDGCPPPDTGLAAT